MQDHMQFVQSNIISIQDLTEYCPKWYIIIWAAKPHTFVIMPVEE